MTDQEDFWETEKNKTDLSTHVSVVQTPLCLLIWLSLGYFSSPREPNLNNNTVQEE